MKKIIALLLSLASLIGAFAQSRLETKYFQSGDDPVREVHCVWLLDMSKRIISKQQDGGAKINMTVTKQSEPQEYEDSTIYELYCDEPNGLVSHKIVQSIPKDISKSPIIILDYPTLNSSHSIKKLPVLKYSTEIFEL